MNTIREHPSPEMPRRVLLRRQSSTKREQLEIKVHVSVVSDETEPSRPYSQSVSFRLNSTPSSSPVKEINPRFKSELYYNPRLKEKITQFEPKLHVDLSCYCLVDDDLAMIVKQIILEKKCTELWLYRNKLTSNGMPLLASSLINNTTLKSLDLSFNRIGDLGVCALADVLLPAHHSSLRILYLSHAGVSDDGAKHLAELLKTNMTLAELWLSDNEIGDGGVQSLAQVLACQNKTLKFLSLSMNSSVTDSSIDALLLMFEQNRTLKSFWLTDCSLTEAGKTKLREKSDGKKPIEHGPATFQY